MGVETYESKPLTVIDRTLAAWILSFCAIVPFKFSELGWVVTTVLVVFAVIKTRAILRQIWISVPLVAYLGWMLLSSVWSVERATTLSHVGINLGFVIFGLLIAVGRTTSDLLALVAKVTMVFLLVNWIVALLAPSVGVTSEGMYIGAMKGLFVDKNSLGYFAVITFVTVGAHAVSATERRERWVAWAGTALSVATILSSGSRTALSVAICAVILWLVLTALAKARRPLLLPVLGWVLVVGIIGWVVAANFQTILALLGRDPTLTGRSKIWTVVMSAIVARPVTGYGWKALWLAGSPTTEKLWAANYNVPFYTAHNGYLDITAQLGVIGLILAMIFLVSLGVAAAKKYTCNPSRAAFWPLVLLAVALISNSTEVVALTNTTWVLLVALSSIITLERRGNTCI